MKLLTRSSLAFIGIISLWSCGNKASTKAKNNDVVTVLNGMDKPDSVRYNCDSCAVFMPSQGVLNKVIDRATKDAKQSLNNPLSFVPRSIKMTVAKEDSLFYYETNKHIDSCLLVSIEYKCIGKNAYGTESEVTAKNLLFIVGDSIRDLETEIRKKPLGIDVADKIVNRELNVFDIDGNGSLSVLPTINSPFSLIVNTSISCIDKGAKLVIQFEDKSKITASNWNEFNCKGTAYFDVTSDMIAQFKAKKISYIGFYGDKEIFASVPKNESEYLMQYANLVAK